MVIRRRQRWFLLGAATVSATLLIVGAWEHAIAGAYHNLVLAVALTIATAAAWRRWRSEPPALDPLVPSP